MTEAAPELMDALWDTAVEYGLDLDLADQLRVAGRLAGKASASATSRDVREALKAEGVAVPTGYPKGVVERWQRGLPTMALVDLILEFRLDAIDALSAQYGRKPKPEEGLRNNLRMYLKGQHQVESRTAKGHTDILMVSRRGIIEVKVWTSRQKYEDGLVELAEYIRTARPPTKEAAFVLFCDDEPLPEVVTDVTEAVIDTRTLSGLTVPVIAVPFQAVAPSKKAYTARRSASGR